MHDANGINNAIRNFPVNGANLGALVAKVGSETFLVGSEREIVIKTDGFLELGIEDCYEDKGEGSCLRDNDHSITAKITVAHQ